jgi:uncharacterized protein (TIGR00369 family)
VNDTTTTDGLICDPEALARAQGSMGPFSDYLGLQLVGFSTAKVVARWPVREALHQPFGLVHGGAFATVVETLPSFGAYLYAQQRGGSVVGVNNNTDLLRSASSGVLDAVAVAVHQGRSQQLWTVEIRLPDGRLAARGSLRLQNLYPGASHTPPGVGPG